MSKNPLDFASRIRTPITVASLAIITFYLIFKLVIRLGIFSNLTQGDTHHLLDSIITKTFIVALVALCLGIGAYVYTIKSKSAHHRPSRSKSRGCSVSITISLILVMAAATTIWIGIDYLKGGSANSPIHLAEVRLQGAGSAFASPLYQQWFTEYNKQHPNVKLDYQSIGSGAGIKQISEKTVDFGSSDLPIKDPDLETGSGQILHIPTVLGAVVIAYNLPGVSSELTLTPEAIAEIFLGKIKKWNEPLIAATNAHVDLPASDIILIHRSEGNGATFTLTDYLSKVSPEWKEKVGAGTSVNWPIGTGARGSEEVMGQIKQTSYSIGYVELIYAAQNKIPFAAIKNSAGVFVRPSLDSITSAARETADQMADDLSVSITDAPGREAYPIAAFTYMLVYKDQSDLEKGKVLVDFLWWAIHDGQKSARELLYAPLPANVVKKAEENIDRISYQGNSLRRMS